MKINTLLLAISLVETGGQDSLIGKAGERGRYQITARTWRQHSKAPHKLASDPVISKWVARRHLEWISGHLPPLQRRDPFFIALAWNAGLKRKRPPSPACLDYCHRVVNTYKRMLELKLP
jgi:hypothetical protein